MHVTPWSRSAYSLKGPARHCHSRGCASSGLDGADELVCGIKIEYGQIYLVSATSVARTPRPAISAYNFSDIVSRYDCPHRPVVSRITHVILEKNSPEHPNPLSRSMTAGILHFDHSASPVNPADYFESAYSNLNPKN